MCIHSNLFWLFSFDVLFRSALLVYFLCMLHPGSQEALDGSLEGPQKIHKQDYYIFLEVLKFVFTIIYSGWFLLMCSLGVLF